LPEDRKLKVEVWKYWTTGNDFLMGSGEIVLSDISKDKANLIVVETTTGECLLKTRIIEIPTPK